MSYVEMHKQGKGTQESVTTNTVRCPNCNYRLPKTTDRLRSLAAENEMLRNKISELQMMLENQEIHAYVTTSRGRCFHLPDCKWLRDVPHACLTETYSHEAAANRKKPCQTCRA